MMRFVSLLVLLCLQFTNALKNVRIGVLDIQMRSSSPSTPAELVNEVMVPVSSFLTDIFRNEYENFMSVRFSVSDFDVVPDGVGGFLGAVSMKGTVTFDETANADIPTPNRVGQVMASAFTQYDQEFLDNLSLVSSNAFLRDISYAVVKVNGDPASTITPGSRTSADDEPIMEVWLIALIAGLSTFMLVLCVCLVWICCCSEVEDESSDANGFVARTISKETAIASEDQSIGDNISPRSITSQDSSKFTYNPGSTRSARGFSFDEGRPAVDVARWQKQQQPLPTRKEEVSISFGQDISEIQNERDLSLIEEGTDEESSPQKNAKTFIPPSLLDKSEESSFDITGSSTGDVIQELNDLSYQISKLRSGGH